MVRARISVVPPGANGTTHLMGLVGHACANAIGAAAATTKPSNKATVRFISSPSGDKCVGARRVDAHGLSGGDQVVPCRVVQRHAAGKPRGARLPFDVAGTEHRP